MEAIVKGRVVSIPFRRWPLSNTGRSGNGSASASGNISIPFRRWPLSNFPICSSQRGKAPSHFNPLSEMAAF